MQKNWEDGRIKREKNPKVPTKIFGMERVFQKLQRKALFWEGKNKFLGFPKKRRVFQGIKKPFGGFNGPSKGNSLMGFQTKLTLPKPILPGFPSKKAPKG